MNSDSDRLKEIFGQALQIKSAAERETYLARACHGEPELRRQVDSLLRAHEQAGDFLSQTMPLPSSDFEIQPLGTLIGRYKLLEKIGEGGFGVVYMAEQQVPVQRKVALKIIKPGMDTREVIARFEAERQALALMDHPNIARVLDGGATEAGRPYFVMELMRGIPITDYCDQNNLPTTERLQLFIKVCQAVQHAHQKAVIHRDLKPSNILVTLHDGEPVPKVIDFGVAKALGQKLTEKTLFTTFRQMIGTPAYMSPEQAEMSGLDIDTRADIYSLGVLLYELLTSVTPFDWETLASAGLDEIRRMIRETEPLKPSTRLRTLGERFSEVAKHRHTEPAALSRLVRGDLDWIVMKCLEKDRTRRYETANGLARDIQRYLSNEPVTAAAPSPLYRANKFVRRHRAALAAASALVLLLAAGAVVSAWQALRATRAERAQRQLRERAEEAEKDAKEKLWASYLAQAHAYRWSGQPGRRFDGLKAVSKAAALRTSPELRDEAVACMALPDILLDKLWGGSPPGTTMLAFDEDMKHYARSNTNGDITVRSVTDDQEFLRLDGPGTNCWSLRFSPNGQYLAARYDSGHVEVWKLDRGERVLEGPFGAVAFSSDSERIAIAEGAVLHLYGLVSKTEHQFNVGRQIDLAFDPKGLRVAVCSDKSDLGVRLLDVDTGNVLVTLPHPSSVNTIAWHSSGRLLASACKDSRVYVWDLTSPLRPVAILEGHRAEPISLAFSHSASLLASISWDQTVRLWDPLGGRQLVTDFGAPVIGFPQLLFSKDDNWLSFAIKGREAGLWKTAVGQECRCLYSGSGSDKTPWSLSFDPQGRVLASGHDDGMRLWDTVTGRELAFLPIGYTRTVLFHPNGESLLTCRETGGVDRWPIQRAQSDRGVSLRLGPPQRLKLPQGTRTQGISLAANGRTLAVADSAREQVILADLNDPSASLTLRGHPSIVAVSISPDAKWVASSSWYEFPQRVRVTEIGSGKMVLQVDSTLNAAAMFSPDGRWLAIDRGDECGIWEVGAWSLSHKLPKEREAGVMTFSPNGSVFALGKSSQVVRLLDTRRDWKEMAALDPSGPQRIGPGCFSPDGSKLAVAADARLIRLWDLGRIRAELAAMALDWDEERSPAPVNPEEPKEIMVTVLDRATASQVADNYRDPAISRAIPPRDPRTAPNLIDLSSHYNAGLRGNWHKNDPENDLSFLPTGLQTFAGVPFDVRGLVQLGSQHEDSRNWFPARVTGIRIGGLARQINFLHSAIWGQGSLGTEVGFYRVHYADDGAVEIPVILGKDVLDWWAQPNERPGTNGLVIAWKGTNAKSQAEGRYIRLFKSTWENPRPDLEISTIDFESRMTEAAPFLVAITAQ